MEARRVNNPINNNMPQIISKVAVKYAQKAALLKPIFKNLPVPSSSGNTYFCMPSDKKISPTTILTSIVLLSLTVLKIEGLNLFFVFMIIKIGSILHLYILRCFDFEKIL
jgi:hypothetical protein